MCVKMGVSVTERRNMSDKEKESIELIVSKIKETIYELKTCVDQLDDLINSESTVEEPIGESVEYRDFWYQQCDLKDGCTSKNCIECPYKKDGKKYYMGGM